MRSRILTPETVLEIKQKLWEGKPQAELAVEYAVTQTTISRILNGIQWSEIPWPDESTGSMSLQQRILVHRERYSIQRADAVVRNLSKLSPVDPRRIARALAELDITEESIELDSIRIDGPGDDDPPSDADNSSESARTEPTFSDADWESFRARFPKNKYIKAAKTEQEKLATMTTLNNLPQSQWGEASTGKLISAVIRQMQGGA